MKRSIYESIILGFAVGDALGVPFEFMESDEIDFKYSDEMQGNGTYNQKVGTFSDDTSMLACSIESLIIDRSMNRMADNFLKWKNEGFWTAHGYVFDIGNTTRVALNEYEKSGDLSGKVTNNEYSCGNGSLMRILALLPYTIKMDLDEKFEFIKQCSSITHGHIRCAIACFIFLEFAEKIITMNTGTKLLKYYRMLQTVTPYLESKPELKNELHHFKPIFDGHNSIPKDKIQNSGYVVDSLFLSIHCYLQYNRYEVCVWYAISFGGDTDTNAALTGCLCTLAGGIKEIPERWLNKIAKKEDLFHLAERWANSLN